ncbi:hypothetical protein AB6A40_000366 [Gnathostoma spinigerum]|uniref:DUF7087 domain-containing protein n=1 Tax=Gnathostoma spinigerum TaxID=75299 RepID=A0ABD6EB12_9BILA
MSQILSDHLHYPNAIYTTRAIQLICIAIQAILLFCEADRIGITFLVPTVVLVYNFYHTGRQWYYSIDGAFDCKHMLSMEEDNTLRVHYGFSFLGSFLLAILTHCLRHELPSGFSNMIYQISNYTSLVASCCGVIAGVLEFCRRSV